MLAREKADQTSRDGWLRPGLPRVHGAGLTARVLFIVLNTFVDPAVKTGE
jgi:hypothetical protein